MNRRVLALAILAVLVVSAIPFVVGGGGSRVAAFLVDPLGAPPLPAPPTARLDAPLPGAGVGGAVSVAGEARAGPGQTIHDVQIRVDGGRWASVPDVARGEPVAAYRTDIDLAPGDHLIEARAWDGASFSIAARALVRAGAPQPPTVRIAEPVDGAGLLVGTVTVSGAALNATRVEIEAGGARVVASVVGDAWTATLALPPGVTTLRAQAQGDGGWSLPVAITLAAGDSPPPTLEIQSPQEGDAFGSDGDAACPSTCILLRGAVSATATRVEATLDGGAPRAASLRGAVWTWQVSVGDLLSGVHRAQLVAYNVAGQASVGRNVTFLVHSPRSAGVTGDEAPRLTGTMLFFAVQPADAGAQWSLDGAPLSVGANAQLTLTRPGDHALRVLAHDDHGRPASLDVPLVALNRPPVATLRARAGLAVADTPFHVDASDADGRVARYAWEFGDGTRAVGDAPDVTHRYAGEGLYRANVTVFDEEGASGASSVLVAIANAPPVARIRVAPGPVTLLDGVQLQDDSYDPEGHLTSRAWDFGDGVTSHDATPVHRFVTRGNHTVTLRVEDALGAAALARATIDVQNIAPSPAFTWTPLSPRAGEPVGFLDLSRKPDGAIMNVSWSFGSFGRSALHVFDAPGRYNISLTIRDDWGALDTATREVDVGDAAPQIRALVADPAKPFALQVVNFSAMGNDAMGGIASLSWDFGDGNVSGLLAPVHAYARSGDYLVSVVARNAANATAVANVTLRVADVPPVARLAGGTGFAGWPITLVGSASSDADGHIAVWRFDADGDGIPDCDGGETRCSFAYAAPGVYLANLTVVDDEGETGSATVPVQVDAPPPALAPPVIAIQKPSSGETLRGATLVSGVASSPRPLSRVEVQLRDATRTYALGPQAWMPASGTGVWQMLLDTTAVPDGDYRIVARAVDEQQAQGTTSLPIKIANGPAASLLTLSLANAPIDAIGPDYDLQGSAFHPQNVTAVRWKLDDEPWRDVVGTPLAFTLPLRALAPGLHALIVDAYHGAFEKKELRVEMRVAAAPPPLVVDDPPGPIAYGLLHAAGRTGGAGVAQWRLDDRPWTGLNLTGGEWRLDAPTRDLPAGHHTLAFRTVGPDGASGETRAWSIRIVRPIGDTRFQGWGADEIQGDAPPPTTPRATPMPIIGPLAALALAAFSRGARRRL